MQFKHTIFTHKSLRITKYPLHRITPQGFLATRQKNSQRDIQYKSQTTSNQLSPDEIKEIRRENRNPDGTYTKGNNGPIARGRADASSSRQKVKQLHNVMLETLLSAAKHPDPEKSQQAITLIENVIIRLAAKKPEIAAALAAKLIPKDINLNVETPVHAPLILSTEQADNILSNPSTRN